MHVFGHNILFFALLSANFGVAAFAGWKGDGAVRWAALVQLCTSVDGLLASTLGGDWNQTLELGAGLVSAAIYLLLAVRFANLWIGGAMLLQAAEFSLASFYLVTDRPLDHLHAWINNTCEWGIVLSILNKHKIPATTENVSGFLDSYVHFLSLELPRRKGELLPGVLELLERLKSRPHVVLALLTGNVSRGAQLKLEHYGVWHFFEFGAFADDHRDRNELGRFARARAKEKHGREFAASEIDVIGDTPRDIACGKALGARTIAVATGRWDREELAKHHPDFLIDDLSNVETIMDTLGW